jgi:uncharacterized membrane protein YphA (DoxX/SURF4 family)
MNRFFSTLPAPLIWLMRALVAVTFIYASVDKIANPGDFAQNVYYYRLVPMALLHTFALLLPWVEMVAGIALLIPSVTRGAALLSGLMTLVFVVGITAALARGLDISCGCFNTGAGHKVGLDLLYRDILLLAGCFLLVIQPPKSSRG